MTAQSERPEAGVNPTRNLYLCFGLSSLAAVTCGAIAMQQDGLPLPIALSNLIAWIIGLGAALLLAKAGPGPRWQQIALILCLIALAATFAVPGISGIHRWLPLGPVNINAAALVLPPAIILLHRIGLSTVTGGMASLCISLLLLLQPDASQAIAFGLAVACLLIDGRKGIGRYAAYLSLPTALATLVRPDRLDPVAHVEQILTLCNQVAPILGISAIAFLVIAGLSPLGVRHGRGLGSLALCAYMIGLVASPLLGWYPVPLIGAGMSFPIGLWLGIGLLGAGLNGGSSPNHIEYQSGK